VPESIVPCSHAPLGEEARLLQDRPVPAFPREGEGAVREAEKAAFPIVEEQRVASHVLVEQGFPEIERARAKSARRSTSISLALGAHAGSSSCQGYSGRLFENSSSIGGRIAPVRPTLYAEGYEEGSEGEEEQEAHAGGVRSKAV
jgi:hypothetical protein